MNFKLVQKLEMNFGPWRSLPPNSAWNSSKDQHIQNSNKTEFNRNSSPKVHLPNVNKSA